MGAAGWFVVARRPLNESPSEKEGKYKFVTVNHASDIPSMKVPPKRKGNMVDLLASLMRYPLNESPSEKEGKYCKGDLRVEHSTPLNESPSEKEGKSPAKKT